MTHVPFKQLSKGHEGVGEGVGNGFGDGVGDGVGERVEDGVGDIAEQFLVPPAAVCEHC